MGHNAFQMSTWSAKGNGTDSSLFYLLSPFWQHKKNPSHLISSLLVNMSYSLPSFH